VLKKEAILDNRFYCG